MQDNARQNLTVKLDRDTIRKAKVLAAQYETSISALVAGQIEFLVASEQRYEAAKRQALALLERGFPLGGRIRATRDELHAR